MTERREGAAYGCGISELDVPWTQSLLGSTMSSFSALAVATRPAGLPTDPLTGCFEAVAIHGGRLAVALLNQHDPDKIIAALAEARAALAGAESRSGEVVAALEPASNGEIEAELTRLVRSWP